jgi:hypothetical protein
MKTMKLIILSTIIFINLYDQGWTAAGEWSEGAKQAYVDRCGSSMNSQGLPLKKARGYCRCVIDAQEIEFGRRDYAAMMKAQPNPNGNNIEQRLYKVLSMCSGWLSK